MGKATVLLATMVALFCLESISVSAFVADTKHNLSVSGNYTVKSNSETRVCVFCHAPHNAKPGAPLWGHSLSNPAEGYLPYQSSTMEATSRQPDGTSKLCLSCHDGTIAVGSLLGRTVSMTAVEAEGSMLSSTDANLGTNLTNDHPVSITPLPGAEIHNPPMGSMVTLDQSGKVQCTSCHNPHGSDLDKFLVKTTSFGALCNECHSKTGWVGSAHEQADKVVSISYWREGPGYAYLAQKEINVRERSCMICHSMHSSLSIKRLLLNEKPAPAYLAEKYDTEEWTCLICHDGYAAKDVSSPIFRSSTISRHNVRSSKNVHDLADPLSVTQSGSSRHVECTDCHEPHQVKSGLHTAVSSDIGPTLNGIIGAKPDYTGVLPWMSLPSSSFTPVTLTAGDVTGSSLEAYLCFKCHPNVAREMNPANGSIHNAIGLEVVPNTLKQVEYGSVPWTNALGYVSPYGPDSQLACSDCHSTPDYWAPSQGPHGSSNEYILEEEHTLTNRYAELLCYNCHRKDIYSLSEDEYSTAFAMGYDDRPSYNLHDEHADIPFSCLICHSAVPHGFKRARFIVYVSDGAPYYNAEIAGYNTDQDGVVHPRGLYGWRDPRSVGRKYYIREDCWSGCHNTMGSGYTYQVHPYTEGVQYEQ